MEDDQNFFSILLLICVYIAQNNALSKSGVISSQATDKWSWVATSRTLPARLSNRAENDL